MEEEEALQQVQDLYSLIQHTESVRSQLMSNVRLLECDRSGSKAAVLESLHRELKECEANLHALKIGYVEKLLETEESGHGRVGDGERSKESEVIAEGNSSFIIIYSPAFKTRNGCNIKCYVRTRFCAACHRSGRLHLASR